MDMEIKKEMMTYVDRGWGLDRKSEKRFKELVLKHEEIAKEVYRNTSHQPGNNVRKMILMFLNNENRGADLAKEEAHRLAYAMEVVDCSKEEEEAFKLWLSGESDSMPDKLPRNKYVVFIGNYVDSEQLCYMSKVSEFTARCLVYGLHRGYVDLFRESVKEMMRNLGVQHTRNFLDAMFERYKISQKDVMQMYSAIFAGGAKTKEEKAFYTEYVEKWLATSKEEYLAAISEISKDCRNKIMKKLSL